jgi:hypothetical protein
MVALRWPQPLSANCNSTRRILPSKGGRIFRRGTKDVRYVTASTVIEIISSTN